MKILVVDDINQNLYMLEVLLKGAGYEVVTAKNGIEALEQLRASQFDGIVSDILMPVMDGFRLIRECKNDPVLRQLPFIFYTATYTEKKDEEFGLSLGAIRYIIKPAEPEELLRQIHEAFKEHARSPRDLTIIPVPDEVAFSRGYTQRVGAKLEKKDQALKESEEKSRLLYENSMDALLFASPDGSVQAANPAACAMFQRTEEEIISGGRNGVVDTTDPRLSAALEERARTGRFKGELTFLRKDGTRFPGEISTNIFTDRTGQKRSSMIIRDVTERRHAEEALRRKSRAYKVISECNQFLIRTPDENDLNRGICKILVTDGGYRGAWVGYARDDRDKTVELVAQYSLGKEFLGNHQIKWKKGHHGNGPTSTAIRTGKPAVIHDIPNNPKCGSWVAEAIRQNYSTVAAFPIIIEGHVIGALTICTSEAEAFDSDEMQLISEMAGDLGFGIASIRVAHERKLAEEALSESENRYRTVFENTGTAMVVVEENNIISLANKEFAKLSGFSKEDVEGKKKWTEFVVKEDLEQMLAQHRLRRQNHEKALTHYEFRFVTRSGDIRNIYLSIEVVPGTKKSVASLLDLTERKKAENALFENEKFLTNIVEHIPDMIFVKDAQHLRFVQFNKAGEDLLGYSREELVGKNDYDFFPKPEADFFTEKDKEVINRNQLLDIPDEKIQTRLKGERILHTKKIPIVDEHGNPKYLLGISEDITERKKAEERLKRFSEELEKQVAERTQALNKSLHEKEILIKEVHHRVKNNMQIITSLLNLQARTIDDPGVLKTIKESQSRIKAMSLVHERLYQSGDISSIDLKDYIQFLARELFSFYGVKSQLVRFNVNAPAINVNIDTAIPLGLMVNELISNAIKYAFPADRRGEIVIDITKDKKNISLVVRDNGIGIPADFDWHNAKSLGIRLVNSLVEQLSGTIELDRSAGTKFTIVVKEKE